MTKKIILSQVWMVSGGLVNFGSYCVGRCPQSFLLLRYIHFFWNKMQHADEFILQCLHYYCNHLKMFASRVLNDMVEY